MFFAPLPLCGEGAWLWAALSVRSTLVVIDGCDERERKFIAQINIVWIHPRHLIVFGVVDFGPVERHADNGNRGDFFVLK